MQLTHWLSSTIRRIRHSACLQPGPRRSRRRDAATSDIRLVMPERAEALEDRTLLASVWTEGFETDGGGGARYTTSDEFQENFFGLASLSSYHGRVRGSDGQVQAAANGDIQLDADPAGQLYTGFEGSFYWAAEAVNTGSRPDFRVIDFNPITTSGFENLQFSGLFGAGDTDTNPSYDREEFLAILTSNDGGTTYIPRLVFRGEVSTTAASGHFHQVNTIAPSNANGVNSLADLGAQLSGGDVVQSADAGDTFSYMAADSGGVAAVGTQLDTVFESFSFNIPNATETRVRVALSTNGNHSEFAFDDFEITGDAVVTNQAPTIQSHSFPNIGEPQIGDPNSILNITYTDDSNIDVSTIDVNDITITKNGGGTAPTISTVGAPGGNQQTAVVQYTIIPPGNSWDAADNGTYTVSMVASQVGDDDGTQLFVGDGVIGTFMVAADNTAPIVSDFLAEDVIFTDFGETSYSFTVEYSDVGGVDASTIGDTDFTVTSPGGVPMATSLMGTTTDPDGTVVNATYSFTPPGGDWDATDDGTYTINIVASEICDVAPIDNLCVADGALTTFDVISTKLLNETFETDGSGTRYTTSNEFFEQAGAFTNYHTRVEDEGGGPTPAILLDADPAGTNYSGHQGDWYFAAENVADSGDGRPDFRLIDFDPINTSAFESMSFMGLFAAGDTDVNPSYDSDAFLAVLYSIDGGVNYVPGLVFRANVSTTVDQNRPFAQVNNIAASGMNGVNNLDDLGAQLSLGNIVQGTGTGEVFSYMAADSGNDAATGTQLNTTFQNFNFNLPDANEIRLRVALSSMEEHEEFAFDNFMVTGTPVPVNQAPVVQTFNFPNIGEPEIGDPNSLLSITYSDDSAIAVATIDINDINITKNGGGAAPTIDSVAKAMSDGTPSVAQYTIIPPGGTWDAADNGTYTVSMVASQVGDDDGTQLFVADGVIGTFTVAATNTAPIVSDFLAEDVISTDFGDTSYSFTIEYTDVGGVDASTIGDTDVTVTSPMGVPMVTSLMGTTTDSDGPVVTATYSFTPPGGDWSLGDAGTYTIDIVASEICDIAPIDNLCVADGVVTTFDVIPNKLLNETFETDGNGTRYTTTNEFFEQAGAFTNYHTRVEDEGAGPNPAIALDADPAGTDYSGHQGDWYFAAENVDDSGGGRPDFRLIDFDPIDATNFTNLSFMGLFAAGDTDVNPSYDFDSFVAVLYSTDGGTTYIPGLVFRANVNTTTDINRPFAQVDNIAPSGINGINTLADLGAQLSLGDVVQAPGTAEVFSYMAADSGNDAATGTLLDTTFQNFSFNLPDAAEIRLRVALNSHQEHIEFAFDSLMVTGDATNVDTTPPVVSITPTTTTDPTPELGGRVDDPGASVSVNVGGNNYAANNNGDGTWTLPDNDISPALPEGIHNVIVTATDGSGNVGTDITTNELRIAVFALDFGAAGSPVESGYTPVLTSDVIPGSPTNGQFGWMSNTGIQDRDRTNAPNDLDRDYHKTNNPTSIFQAALPNGDYNVSYTIGSAADPRDNVGVSLEGTQVGSVTTARGQFETRTHLVTVADGILDLQLQRNGSTSAGINALVVLPATLEPRLDLTDGAQFHRLGGPATAIDPALMLTDPDDLVLTGAVVSIIGGFVPNEDELGFVNQNGIMGTYDPNTGVLTLTGNATVAQYEQALRSVTFNTTGMQAGPRTLEFLASDGTTGSGIDSKTVNVLPPTGANNAFDFNATGSPTEPGFTPVTIDQLFSGGFGFGWLDDAVTNGISARDRGAPDALRQDYHKVGAGSMTFAVIVPNGTYDVTVTIGSNVDTRNNVGVFLEDTQVDTVSTARSQFATNTYRATVADGRLEVRLTRQGSTGVGINSLQIAEVTGAPNVDLSNGPGIFQVGGGAVPIDAALTVEDIDSANLAGATVSIIAGHNNAADTLAFTDQNGISGNFVSATGILTLTGSASVANYQTALRTVTFNTTDNVGMRTIEVTVDDGTTTDSDTRDIFVTAPFTGASFDFGTPTSDVQPGFLGVNETLAYAPVPGFGWLSTTGIESRNRSAPVPLDERRDYNLIRAGSMTFAVSLPNGTYDITFTIGSSENARDNVGVLMEGTQVATVSSALGTFVTQTHRVTVSDNRLDVEIARQGTTAAAINSLIIAEVP